MADRCVWSERLYQFEEDFGPADVDTVITLVQRVVTHFRWQYEPACVFISHPQATEGHAYARGWRGSDRPAVVFMLPNPRRLVVAHELAHLVNRVKHSEVHDEVWLETYKTIADALWPAADLPVRIDRVVRLEDAVAR